MRFGEIKRRQSFHGGSIYSKADMAAIKELQQPSEDFIDRSVSPAVLAALDTLARDARLLHQFRRDPAGFAVIHRDSSR